MLRLATNDARSGMVLAQPVYHPLRPGHVLLKPGAVLDGGTIGRLGEYGVATLWIRYPALDFLRKYASPELAEAQARLTSLLETEFDAAARSGHARLDYAAYAGSVRSMLEEIVRAPEAGVLIEEMHSRESSLLTHASNVCFLSLLLGLRLEGYLVGERNRLTAGRAKKIENLGVGALLHDAGVLSLPPEARAKWLATYDLSDPALRRHVLLGFEMLRGSVAPTAAAIALHHHQRYNGTGFPAMPRLGGKPAPLAGQQIHIFSRIVAVADEFDRLRRPPGADRAGLPIPPVPAVRVLRRLLGRAAAREIDPTVFRALLMSVPAFAPGSIVRLSDGDPAVVTGWAIDDPCRPTVRHLLRIDSASADQSSLGPPIDLRSRSDLAVAQAEGQNISADLFDRHELRKLGGWANTALPTGRTAA